MGFASWCDCFRENKIDGEVLLTLNENDLKNELGMSALGDRRRFFKRRDESSQAQAPPVSKRAPTWLNEDKAFRRPPSVSDDTWEEMVSTHQLYDAFVAKAKEKDDAAHSVGSDHWHPIQLRGQCGFEFHQGFNLYRIRLSTGWQSFAMWEDIVSFRRAWDKSKALGEATLLGQVCANYSTLEVTVCSAITAGVHPDEGEYLGLLTLELKYCTLFQALDVGQEIANQITDMYDIF